MPTEAKFTQTTLGPISRTAEFMPSTAAMQAAAKDFKIPVMTLPGGGRGSGAEAGTSSSASLSAKFEPSEEEAIAALVGQVTPEMADSCVNMINAFVNDLGTTEGLSAEGFAWTEELSRLISMGASEEKQMIAIYRIAQAQYMMAVADCILTYFAYLDQVAATTAGTNGETGETVAIDETGIEEMQYIDGSGLLEENNQKQAECEASGLVWERAIDSTLNNGTCVAAPSGPPMAPFGLPMTQQNFRYAVAAGVVGVAAWFFLLRK
jgi:hypothetical protein